ncbi:SDR family oxidoreductase [Bacillus sonorensis]|uniref:General stress protein 39 n=1 Tax=Bacillus sonorensis TaxID=119858 RepID=A0ABN5AJV8_9BACI|nr:MULTISPECIES: SDR family oxidoreductase [Bacillus]ASB90991.1 General stress protein 39 [Bacillus sonorensis]MBG9913487.1 short-chain dehydrogenase [Bacillus sonorensis]MCF7619796.1 SDR family oxidoreductase [Bacillus sonorensis]MCY7858354.1 SDR family oxidoreductase [Bacillus sonorensis]MCY8027530.1 SDR family oxidoreductase [Bacillus sonorensis]
MDLRNRQTDGQPAQTQDRQPGIESVMKPRPVYEHDNHKGTDKLKGKVALITGGDSGIGRAVAVAYAKEGADISIVYLNEHEDAQETKARIEQEGVKCLMLPGDVGDEAFCNDAVERTVKELGRLDILVNNAAEQHPKDSIKEISGEQLERTFRTNFYSYFHFTKKAIDYLEPGSAIINTTSINPYRGNPQLIDYTATKGAINAFTRSMSQALVKDGIRVNAVAPGPIWTPLIPSTFSAEEVAAFGTDTPMGRPGQPADHVGCYVLLASDDSSYMTGQTLHVNGGDFITT